MAPNSIRLYRPELWSDVLPANDDGSPLAGSVVGRVAQDLEEQAHVSVEQSFSVSDTGHDNHAIRKICNSETRDTLPILILPITHFLLQQNRSLLTLLGPAIATRNDVYLFRHRRPKTSPFRPQWLRFATIGRHITTSLMIRVALGRSSPEPFFFSAADQTREYYERAEELWLHHASFVRAALPYVDCEELPQLESRLDRLRTGSSAGAVVTGKELRTNGLLDREDLIDFMDLNRMMNHIYDISFFPRAVYCCPHWAIDELAETRLLGLFFHRLNNHIPASLHEPLARHQRLTHTYGHDNAGPSIDVLIQFATDVRRFTPPDTQRLYGEPFESLSEDDFFGRKLMRVRREFPDKLLGLRDTPPIIDMKSSTIRARYCQAVETMADAARRLPQKEIAAAVLGQLESLPRSSLRAFKAAVIELLTEAEYVE